MLETTLGGLKTKVARVEDDETLLFPENSFGVRSSCSETSCNYFLCNSVCVRSCWMETTWLESIKCGLQNVFSSPRCRIGFSRRFFFFFRRKLKTAHDAVKFLIRMELRNWSAGNRREVVNSGNLIWGRNIPSMELESWAAFLKSFKRFPPSTNDYVQIAFKREWQ